MDTGHRIFEDLQRHLKSLQQCKNATLLEENQALANAQRRMEISEATKASITNLNIFSKKAHAIIYEEYQEEKAALDRDYKEKMASLDAITRQQLDEIRTAEAEQRSSLLNENFITRRRAARELQERLAKNEWMSLRTRISALGISTSAIADSSTFLKIPEALVPLKESLERVDSVAKGSPPTKSTQATNEPAVNSQATSPDSRTTTSGIGHTDQSCVVDMKKTDSACNSSNENNHNSLKPGKDRKRKLGEMEDGELKDDDLRHRTKIPRQSPSAPKKKDSSDRTEQQPSSRRIPRIPRIDRFSHIRKDLIKTQSIRCPYIFISDRYVLVSQDMLSKMKAFFKKQHATDVLADKTGYYVLYDTVGYGNPNVRRCYFNCHKTYLMGYELYMVKRLSEDDERYSRSTDRYTPGRTRRRSCYRARPENSSSPGI